MEKTKTCNVGNRIRKEGEELNVGRDLEGVRVCDEQEIG